MKEVELNNGSLAYEYEDIMFCNTSEFSASAKHFLKHGCYTFAPYGTVDFNDFWEAEEYKILNGVSLPGKLIVDSKGKHSIQDVHITGHHYAYLNYAQIKLTQEIKIGVTAEKIVKNVTHTNVARKVKTFPEFWDGDYHYFKTVELAERTGKNIVIFKARRKGYSYKNGFIVAEKTNFIPNNVAIIGAFDKKYLNSADGTMTMAKNYLDFFELNTNFIRGYLKDNAEERKTGYEDVVTRIDRGYKSSLIMVSFQNNSSAAAGKDASIILLEEAGIFPNLQEVYSITQPTLEDGDVVTGMMIIFGTGGTKGANWETLEKMFYNPTAYNAVTFNNVWDENQSGYGCGFFHSYLQNLKPYVDDAGNSDFVSAKIANDSKIENKKNTERDADLINQYIGQRCTSPSEGFSRTGDNLFSSKELDDHIDRVGRDSTLINLPRVGILEYDKKGVKFTYNDMLDGKHKHEPIRDYPFKAGQDPHGAFVEYYPPFKDFTGTTPSNLYRVWVDPFGIDKDKDKISTKDSLMTIIVYERTNTITPYHGDIIVGIYVGRPNTMDEANEIVLKITKYYNAECQYESDRGDVKGYFKRAGYYHLLADEPEAFHRKNLEPNAKRNKGVKMGASPERKGTAAITLKDWLYKVRKLDEFNNPVFNFNYIYDLGILKELQKWDMNGNFDRVSALLVGMYDKQDVFDKSIKEAAKTTPNDFFNRSFFS